MEQQKRWCIFTSAGDHNAIRLSHVWVSDDDIRMSAAQIHEAFAIAEFFKFWVAQPSFLQEGKISHLITRYAGPQCDYRIVNFIEENVPIFSRVKLIEFMRAYDGSLTGWGIDYWYLNLFGENGIGRFAIIDKVTVINPQDEEKGGGELDRLQLLPLRLAAWREAKAKYGLVEIQPEVFASCKISSRKEEAAVTRLEVARQTAIRLARS
jgi:hypothetical protein